MSTIRVGDIDMHYEIHGSGHPLLLVMGLATDSVAWMFQVPDFQRRYKTIVFDNRGVGRTSKPAGPYSIHQMADDAAGLMDAIGIESAHVVGVSMGGMIAQELALRHPDKVTALVLACTYPEPDAAAENQRSFIVGRLGGSVSADGQLQVDISSLNPMMFLQQMLPTVFSPSFIQSELPKMMQIFAGSLQYGFSLEAILGQVAAVMGHRATDRLHQVRVPTLVITGDADNLVLPTNSDVLAREIPGAKLVKVPGGSHGFNFEMPEIFNRAVLDFLGTVPAGNAGATA